jgi:phosphatidylglycerol:prolipoprotein diacylglycerol transferase
LAQGIGRWGNFINQEAFGTNTDSLFAMTGGQIQRTIINETAYMDGDMYMNGLNMSEEYAVHPCFLYESFWCLLGFILLSLFIKRRKYDGQIALMYVGWYGIGRFFIEGLRTDSLMVGELKASQVFAGLCAITAIVILVLMEIKYKKSGGEGFVLYVNTEESKQLLAEAEKARNGEDDDKDYTSIVSDENANDENNENNTESEITEEKENGTVN